MSPTPEYRTLHGTLSNNNRMTGILGIGGGTANYENLINKPSINNVTLIGNKNTEDLGLVAPSDLSEVAFSGDYDDLTDKPTIPSKVSDLTNDSGFITIEDLTASNVDYDNTASGISSDDVQSAIDNIINAIRNAVILATASGKPATFTTDMTEKLLFLNVDISLNQTGTGTATPSNIKPISKYTQLTITANGSSITLSFGQDVYLGSFNADTGVLTITHAYKLCDGTENWLYSASGNNARVFLPIAGSKKGSINVYSNMLEGNPTPTNNYPLVWKMAFNSNATPSLLIGVDTSVVSSADDWKDIIENNNLQVVYELDTPVSVSLDPVIINTISGANSVTATTGNVTLKYIKSVGGELS